MSVAVTIDFRPKVFVIREQNPVLRERFLYDGLIDHSPRFVIHGEDLMALRTQPGGDGWPCALIHQKTHLRPLCDKRHEGGIF